MEYKAFLEKQHFGLEELIAFSYGRLIADSPADFDARLPAPPFLMIDRIVCLEKNGNRGRIVAEQDIRIDAWYFQCHFPNGPITPGGTDRDHGPGRRAGGTRSENQCINAWSSPAWGWSAPTASA